MHNLEPRNNNCGQNHLVLCGLIFYKTDTNGALFFIIDLLICIFLIFLKDAASYFALLGNPGHLSR